MAASSEARREENVISLAAARAERHSLPVSLDMDWDLHPAEEEPWALGKTIWFAVAISAGLWLVIAGVLWMI